MSKLDKTALGLVGPFTKIARAMSAQWNVSIVPHAFKCDTDGETIRIPFTSDHLPDGEQQVLHGLLDHEVCHVVEEREHRDAGRRTPVQLLNLLVADKTDRSVKTRCLLLNTFEDIRIEAKWGVQYPGVSENLARKNKHFADKYIKEKGVENFWSRISLAILFKARGFEVEWLDAATSRYMEVIGDEMEAIKHAAWVQDSLDIAERTYKKIRALAEEELKPEPEVATAPKGPGDEEAPETEDDGEGETSEEKFATTVLSTEADDVDFDEPAEREFEEAVRREAKSSKRYIPDPEMTKCDKWFAPTEKMLKGMENYNKSKDEVSSQIAAIRGRQLAYIQTISRKKRTFGVDSGELDDNDLHAVPTGDRRVYHDVQPGLVMDSAIEVLLDLSGSMADGDDPRCAAYYCKRAAIALAEAWEPLRIPYEIIGFYNSYERRGARSYEPGTVGRTPFDFVIIKGWDERLGSCRNRFTAIRGYGDNADGEAVWAAATRLSHRSQKKKHLVVISDGQPACAGIDSEMLDNHLRHVVRTATSSGIRVLGAGAGTVAPAKYYNASTGAQNMIINDLTTLAPSLFKAIGPWLMGT